MKNVKVCISELKGKQSPLNKKTFEGGPKSLKKLFFSSEEIKDSIVKSDFQVIGLRFNTEDKSENTSLPIVEEIVTDEDSGLDVSLIVRDQANEKDLNKYSIILDNPQSFFNIKKSDLRKTDVTLKSEIKSKTQTLKNRVSTFVSGLLQRDGNHYRLVDTSLKI